MSANYVTGAIRSLKYKLIEFPETTIWGKWGTGELNDFLNNTQIENAEWNQNPGILSAVNVIPELASLVTLVIILVTSLNRPILHSFFGDLTNNYCSITD